MGMENSRTFIRQDTLRDAIIYEIIDWEWNMMILWKQKTGKAPGEEEFEDFYRVRYSQHDAMNSDTLALYKSDLSVASHTGRNLMEEKYAFIEAASKGVAPAPIDPAAEKLGAEIMPLMKASNEKFAAKYPSLASAGQAFGGEVSPAVYMESELRIMEVPTLQMMLRDVKLDPDYVQKIYQGLIGFFGQDSLEKAEVLTKAQTMQSCRGKTL